MSFNLKPLSFICLVGLLLLSAPFLTPVSAIAEENPLFTREWGNLGLYGGQVYDIEIDARHPDRLFAGTYYGDGLFLSTNGGVNWAPVLTGHEGGEFDGEATFRNTAVWAVKIAPSRSDTVWAVHNYWAEYSLDGADSWNHILNSRMQGDCTNCGGSSDQFRFCKSLAIDPVDPDRVYVGTSGPYGAVAGGAVFRTDDGGVNWTKTGLPETHQFDDTVVDIAVHPNDPSQVWAVTPSKLYRTGDYGNHWSEFLPATVYYYDLEHWPADPDIVFIATSYGILSNYTGVWAWAYEKLYWARALAFDPQDPTVLYATSGTGGVVRGKYNPTSNEFVFGQVTDLNMDFLTLEVDPSDGNTLFGGELRTGVYELTYDSAGDDFTADDRNEGINAISASDIDAIPAVDASPSYLIAATGIGVSYRIGEGDWTPASTQGLPNAFTYSVAFEPATSDGSAFYVGGEGFLARTTNRGTTWAIVNTSIPDSMQVTDIAVESDGSTLFITTRQISSSAGRVYKSTDNGATLSLCLSSSLYDFNTVTIDPGDPNHILAGGGNYFVPRVAGDLHESFNGGDDWSLTGLIDITVNALLIDPDDSDVIYAGCGYSGGTLVPLYKSSDGGTSWQPSYNGMPGRPTRPGVWSDEDDVFVLGHTGSVVKGGYDDMKILYYDGSAWFNDMQSNVLDHLKGIWGASDSDIYAVGEHGVTVHYDGSDWSPMQDDTNRTTDQTLNAVWGDGTSTVYAVGEEGTLLHFSGSSWSAISSPTTAHLFGVWGHHDAGSYHVYAVGALGTILRYDGSSWSTMESGVNAKLSGVWCADDGSAVYAVGDPVADLQGDVRYTVLRFDGSSWSRMGAPIVDPGEGRLNGVWGTSPRDVYAVGDDGVILHFNGTSWTPMTSGSTADLLAVWGASSNQVYAVGRQGTVLLYDGAGWAVKDIDPEGLQIERLASWNAVTDLKFKLDPGGNRNVYAATDRQGVYFSPNQGHDWINLLSPPYSVSALAVGSIYVASYGVFAYQGVGYIAGEVKDALTMVGLPQATVTTETGVSDATNPDGIYVLPLVAGNYNITANTSGYKPETAYDVPARRDGNVVNFYLSDPPVYARIDGEDILGINGVFEASAGSIRPLAGEYGWSQGGDCGYLQVPYPYGWVQLGIEPHSGNQILDVLVNGTSHGPVTEYSFLHPDSEQTIEAIFGPLASLCDADIDQDGDVDGSDVYRFNLGIPTGASVADLGNTFGRSDCQP